jgi:hypothetical protein
VAKAGLWVASALVAAALAWPLLIRLFIEA